MTIKSFRLPIYTKGKQVTFQGSLCTIENILISRYRILIKLKEHPNAVDSDRVSCEPTEFSFTVKCT